jgi:hypothetical protein
VAQAKDAKVYALGTARNAVPPQRFAGPATGVEASKWFETSVGFAANYLTSPASIVIVRDDQPD